MTAPWLLSRMYWGRRACAICGKRCSAATANRRRGQKSWPASSGWGKCTCTKRWRMPRGASPGMVCRRCASSCLANACPRECSPPMPAISTRRCRHRSREGKCSSIATSGLPIRRAPGRAAKSVQHRRKRRDSPRIRAIAALTSASAAVPLSARQPIPSPRHCASPPIITCISPMWTAEGSRRASG